MRCGPVLMAACVAAGLLSGLLPGALPAVAAASTPATAAATAVTGEPLYSFNTGLVLTVSTKPGRGSSVRLAANSGGAGQRWVFGRHQTVRPAANQKLCLNVPGARYRGGEKLQLWTCDDHASERFTTSAPSGHTQVFVVRPSARTRFCLTGLGSEPVSAGDRLGLVGCAGLISQAWSFANLAGTASYVAASTWVLQAQRPAAAGTPVTGADLLAYKLDQYWTASNVGAQNQSNAMLHPVSDTALCATLSAAERANVSLTLAACDGGTSQQFMGIGLFFGQYTDYFITTPDGHYCLQGAASGPKSVRPVVVGRCGDDGQVWLTELDLMTNQSDKFQEIYVGPNDAAGAFVYSMRVTGGGGAGSDVSLSNDNQFASQVWVALPDGQTQPEANPDGSISVRPLSDEALCLAVPGGDYAAGVQLTVQTCDGGLEQEFVRGQDGPTDLVAAGGGEFCVAAAGMSNGSAVQLEPCEQQNDQLWSQFFDWADWPGQTLSGTGPVATPADALVLAAPGPAGGAVGVIPSPGLSAWDTSEDWTPAAVADGSEVRSVYDPGLCLDAADTAAGTQLTAMPCVAGTAQTFVFPAASNGHGSLWELRSTMTTSRMCVAVGSVSGAAGLPLVLQACSATAADEAWDGPQKL